MTLSIHPEVKKMIKTLADEVYYTSASNVITQLVREAYYRGGDPNNKATQ